MQFGLLTVSDTCFQDPSQDKSGPTLQECLNSHEKLAGSKFVTGIVPDDKERIKQWLIEQIPQVDVILTTGGTGFSSRDVTPEATREIIERPCPGIVVALLKVGLEKTPLAALSRPEAGICKQCLIVNLPGSPKACRESVPVLAEILPHAVSLLQEDKKQVQQTHTAMRSS
ncbi:Gephyrin [Aphelenchoides bicaudatus]|nr:Gephyrin [Aphelenchoides bicaudatus]